MELSSGLLSEDDYRRALIDLADLLRKVGVEEVSVAFGFGCDCPDELLFVDQPLPLERLLPFIAESEASDYYRVGSDNFHINDVTNRWQILLCHESDVHFTTNDESLIQRVEAAWLARGYRGLLEKVDGAWRNVAVEGQ
jgi:hypothetical protein